MLEAHMLRAAGEMGISLSPAQARQFSAYHDLLIQWNEKMNLTRVPLSDIAESCDRNYLDSIAPLGVPGLLGGAKTLIDVGAGAGFPGIPLSIMLPDAEVLLLDALKKRVGFLGEVSTALQLNARAEHARAEDAAHLPHIRGRFDVAVARAVASLPKLMELCMPMIRVGGLFVAYKGPSLEGELAQSERAIKTLGGGNVRVIDVSIPGRDDWAHKLCIIEKLHETPARYPRKPAEMDKRPL